MKTSKLRTIISNNLFLLSYAFRYTKGYLFHVCLFAVYSAIEVFFEFTYCTKYMINLIQYHGKFIHAVYYMGAITTAIIIKIIWAVILTHKITPKAKETLHKKMQEELFRNAIHLDLACYDNPEYYNEFVWSIKEAGNRIDEQMNDISKLCAAVTTIVVMGVFFLTQDKIGLLFVTASLLLTLLLQFKVVHLKFDMEMKFKTIQRKRNYFNRIFYLSDYAKEIRLNPVAEQLKEEFRAENEKVFPIVKQYGRKQTVLNFIGDFVANNFLLDVIYLIYLLYMTIVKVAFSYGSMIALFEGAERLKNSLKTISTLLPKFSGHSLYVEKIRSFLNYEPTITDGEQPKEMPQEFKELRLQNVTFGYESQENIINNVSFSIKAGEKIAIVGYNGAGKTTLTKLLMRLYDVNDGEIILNGKNIKEYAIQDYRKWFGSVFQDYKIYAASVAENVKMDQVNEKDHEALFDALKQSGFESRLQKMSHGLETNLTREFEKEGTNLSGGEAQKLAIARVFYKNCPIIILDEPSSALDPISEYHFNHTMLQAAKEKAVVFISHRLSSTCMADRIYLFEKGKVVEEGNHEQLMQKGGKYAEMFLMQAEKYQVL